MQYALQYFAVKDASDQNIDNAGPDTKPIHKVAATTRIIRIALHPVAALAGLDWRYTRPIAPPTS